MNNKPHPCATKYRNSTIDLRNEPSAKIIA